MQAAMKEVGVPCSARNAVIEKTRRQSAMSARSTCTAASSRAGSLVQCACCLVTMVWMYGKLSKGGVLRIVHSLRPVHAGE